MNTISHQREHIDELRKQKEELQMRLVSAEIGAVLWEEEAKKWQKLAEDRQSAEESVKTEPMRDVEKAVKKATMKMAKAARKRRRMSR